MKIYNNNAWKFYADLLLGGSTTKPLIKKNIGKNGDTVHISWRARREMRNAEIEKMLNNGEPMKGVTFEEYRDYYYDTHGKTVSCDIRQQYSRDLKGDNAALRNKEWRTNPNYRVPQRLFSSPEVTADREAVIEKLRRGEEIAEWETRLLHTFPNVDEGIRLEDEARLEATKVKYQNKISTALSEAGIELSKDDELQFEVWGYDMTVTGTISGDKLELAKETLADYAHDLQYIYQISGHSDEAKAGGLALAYLQSAEKFLKEAGGGSVFDIGKDSYGNFTGLPGDLGEFIKKNAKGTFGIGTEVYQDRNSDVKRALFMREVFNSAIKTVQNGDYNRLKAMTCKLTYKNGILSC